MSAELSRLIRFSITGGLVACIYVGGYTLLSAAEVAPFIANLAAFSAAVAVQYVMQTCWTFRRSLFDRTQSVRFFSVILIGVTYSSLIASFVGPYLGWLPWFSAGLVAVTLPVINYVSFRLWVYGPEEIGNEGQ